MRKNIEPDIFQVTDMEGELIKRRGGEEEEEEEKFNFKLLLYTKMN